MPILTRPEVRDHLRTLDLEEHIGGLITLRLENHLLTGVLLMHPYDAEGNGDWVILQLDSRSRPVGLPTVVHAQHVLYYQPKGDE